MSVQVQLETTTASFALRAAFEITPGILAILGPSGSGKTRLLRALAGLDTAAGHIHDQQHDLNRLASHKRGISFLDQRSALLPHLSVAKNLAFAARRGPHPYSQAQQAELIAELELGALLNQLPRHLSGGEQQRAALARALIGGAKRLLLDEPGTNLDHQAQENFLAYLPHLAKRHALSIVLVTHQLWEAARIADRAALMDGGQLGAVQNINTTLSSATLAIRPDALTCLDLPIMGYDPQDHLISLRCGEDLIQLPRAHADMAGTQRILIPAQSVSLSRQAATSSDHSTLNQLRAQLCNLHPAGLGQVCAVLETTAGKILARITTKSSRALDLTPGCHVVAHIKATALQ